MTLSDRDFDARHVRLRSWALHVEAIGLFVTGLIFLCTIGYLLIRWAVWVWEVVFP